VPSFILKLRFLLTLCGVPLCSAGGLYSHTAAKIVFVRFFRHTKHMYNHTFLGWAVWITLCVLAIAAACVLAIAVPIFSYLIGISAALFASWVQGSFSFSPRLT
jgi:hypothetical protein